MKRTIEDIMETIESEMSEFIDGKEGIDISGTDEESDLIEMLSDDEAKDELVCWLFEHGYETDEESDKFIIITPDEIRISVEIA